MNNDEYLAKEYFDTYSKGVDENTTDLESLVGLYKYKNRYFSDISAVRKLEDIEKRLNEKGVSLSVNKSGNGHFGGGFNTVQSNKMNSAFNSWRS